MNVFFSPTEFGGGIPGLVQRKDRRLEQLGPGLLLEFLCPGG